MPTWAAHVDRQPGPAYPPCAGFARPGTAWAAGHGKPSLGPAFIVAKRERQCAIFIHQLCHYYRVQGDPGQISPLLCNTVFLPGDNNVAFALCRIPNLATLRQPSRPAARSATMETPRASRLLTSLGSWLGFYKSGHFGGKACFGPIRVVSFGRNIRANGSHWPDGWILIATIAGFCSSMSVIDTARPKWFLEGLARAKKSALAGARRWRSPARFAPRTWFK